MITYPNLSNAGRIGNQLWQIASTMGIAHSLGDEANFPAWDYQEFFCIPEHFFQGQPGKPATDFVPHLPPQAVPYLQDYSLWRDIESDIKQWFQPSPLAMQVLAEYKEFWALEPPILSVHVRRGDNVDPPIKGYHPLRPISYYLEALEMLEDEYESIVFFSDDLEWCEDTFGIEHFYFYGGTARLKEHEPGYKTAPFDDWIDLQAMSFCDKHILSNSSYSYWGAMISDDDSPIYPEPFFGPRLSMLNAKSMFPEGWRSLNHAHGSR